MAFTDTYLAPAQDGAVGGTEIEGVATHVTNMDVCPGDKTVAMSTAHGTVILLELESLNRIREIVPEPRSGSKDSFEEAGQVKAATPIRCCRFSSDGRLLAVGYDSGTVEVGKKLVNS